MKAQIDLYLELFIGVIIFSLFIFTILILINAFPIGNAKSLMGSIVSITLSFVDYIIFLLLLVLLIFDLWHSYENPTTAKAFFNIIGIFILGFFGYILNGVLTGSLAFMGLSTNLPKTFALFTGGTAVFILYLFMILSIILNVRSNEQH